MLVKRQELSRRLRRCAYHNIIEQAERGAGDIAIYFLTDPRDVLDVHYVGQTRDPVARFRQHVNAARLWIPEETPWWIKREELRPVYTWIRTLYSDEGRLPTMVIVRWTTADLARLEERRHVRALVADDLPLLNREAEAIRARAMATRELYARD